jgi:hypothetical protein
MVGIIYNFYLMGMYNVTYIMGSNSCKIAGDKLEVNSPIFGCIIEHCACSCEKQEPPQEPPEKVVEGHAETPLALPELPGHSAEEKKIEGYVETAKEMFEIVMKNEGYEKKAEEIFDLVVKNKK